MKTKSDHAVRKYIPKYIYCNSWWFLRKALWTETWKLLPLLITPCVCCFRCLWVLIFTGRFVSFFCSSEGNLSVMTCCPLLLLFSALLPPLRGTARFHTGRRRNSLHARIQTFRMLQRCGFIWKEWSEEAQRGLRYRTQRPELLTWLGRVLGYVNSWLARASRSF